MWIAASREIVSRHVGGGQRLSAEACVQHPQEGGKIGARIGSFRKAALISAAGYGLKVSLFAQVLSRGSPDKVSYPVLQVFSNSVCTVAMQIPAQTERV